MRKVSWAEVFMNDLVEWLRLDTDSGYSAFPREVSKYRNFVEDFNSFLNWCSENYASDYFWASIYSVEQQARHSFDTVFIDFDLVDKMGLDGSLEAMEKVVEYFIDSFPRVRLYFSGRKGFHVYLDFGSNIFFNDFKKSVRAYVDECMRELGVEYDKSAVGDVRRVARVVGNVVENSRVCLRLNQFSDKNIWKSIIMDYMFGDSVLDRMYERWKDLKVLGEPHSEFRVLRSDKNDGVKYLKEIDDGNDVFDGYDSSETSGGFVLKSKELPPCVAGCVEELSNTGELEHGGRILLALWMIYAGYSDDYICNVFRAAQDFKESYTRYQIKHLRERGYLMYSCNKIALMGYCPYKCSLYPWMVVKKE